MLGDDGILLHQKTALQCYINNPAQIDSLLTEGYTKETALRQQNVCLEFGSSEELESYIEDSIAIYTLMFQQAYREPRQIELYKCMRPEQFKEWLRNSDNPSFLLASDRELQVEQDNFLIKFTIDKEVPYIPIQKVLGDTYTNQILVSTYCQITEQHMPKGSMKKEILMQKPFLKSFSTQTMKEQRNRVLQNFKAIKIIFDKIGKEPLSRQEILLYTNWKRTLITYIRARMKQVNEMV